MAKHMNLLLLVVILFPSAMGDYNVLHFGAKADGHTDSTGSFLKAWATACNSVNPTTIYVPSGQFLLKQAVFQGPCRNKRIVLRIDGTIVAPSNYADLGSSDRWLLFNKVEGVKVYGGTLDGRGTALWACKAAGRNCPAGATTLSFQSSKDIVISGLTSINSQQFHITINGCTNVAVQGVRIIASGNSPNTDGIHVQLSTGVTITGSNIKTGDDCISIGPGTKKLWVEGIACGPGHGISIGSLAKSLNEAGVQNVTIKTVVFRGTDNGLRIKSWGRPSNGFVKGVVFQHAVMNNVKNPIVIDQNYCPGSKNCPNQASGIKISGVTYQDIKGTSATQVAVKFDCSSSSPCKGIGLEDVKLTYKNKPAQSSCKNAAGTSSGLVVPPSCL